MPHALRPQVTDVVNDKVLATDWQAVGARLRASREAQSLHPSIIAGRLCLSQRQVLAIEHGETQPFPSDTTRVWCVRRYATLLGLDWVAVVGVPATSPAPEPDAAAAIDVPAPAADQRPARTVRTGPIVLAASLALAVVAGFFLFNVDGGVTGPEQQPVGRDTAAPREASVTPALAPETTTAALPVEEIRGGDPAKSSTAVFVRAEQAVIVFKRGRDGGEETRLEVSPGNATRVSIADGDMLRVESPRDARLYYQGRQVPREAIERGAWLRFTPL